MAGVGRLLAMASFPHHGCARACRRRMGRHDPGRRNLSRRRRLARAPRHPSGPVSGRVARASFRLPERLASDAPLLPGLAHGSSSLWAVAGTFGAQLGGAAVDMVRRNPGRVAVRSRAVHVAGGGGRRRRPGALQRHGPVGDVAARRRARRCARAPRQARPGVGPADRPKQTARFRANSGQPHVSGVSIARPDLLDYAAALSSGVPGHVAHAPASRAPPLSGRDRRGSRLLSLLVAVACHEPVAAGRGHAGQEPPRPARCKLAEPFCGRAAGGADRPLHDQRSHRLRARLAMGVLRRPGPHGD